MSFAHASPPCPESPRSPMLTHPSSAIEEPRSRSMEKYPRPKIRGRSSVTATFRQTTSRPSAFPCSSAATFNRQPASLSPPSSSANQRPNSSGPARTPSAAASVWALTGSSTARAKFFPTGRPTRLSASPATHAAPRLTAATPSWSTCRCPKTGSRTTQSSSAPSPTRSSSWVRYAR